MGDRAPLTARLAWVPDDDDVRWAIADQLSGYGCYLEGPADAGIRGHGDWWEAKDVHAGLSYVNPEANLGSDDELASALAAIHDGIIARVHQDAVYEWDASTVYVAGGETWTGTGTQDGALLVSADAVDAAVKAGREACADSTDLYDDLLERLGQLTGGPFREAFDRAWAEATTPMFVIREADGDRLWSPFHRQWAARFGGVWVPSEKAKYALPPGGVWEARGETR